MVLSVFYLLLLFIITYLLLQTVRYIKCRT